MIAQRIILGQERHVDMNGFHQAFFLFLSVLAFGVIQLSFWWRDRKAGIGRPRYRRGWWRIKAWGKRDWLVVGFFAGYGGVILIYWLSGLLSDYVVGVIDK